MQPHYLISVKKRISYFYKISKKCCTLVITIQLFSCDMETAKVPQGNRGVEMSTELLTAGMSRTFPKEPAGKK